MRCALFLRIVSVFCRVWKAKATGTLFRPGILEAAEHAPASGGLRWNEYQTETGYARAELISGSCFQIETTAAPAGGTAVSQPLTGIAHSAEGFSSRIQPPIECIHSLP
jgi:hypothetical protein